MANLFGIYKKLDESTLLKLDSTWFTHPSGGMGPKFYAIGSFDFTNNSGLQITIKQIEVKTNKYEDGVLKGTETHLYTLRPYDNNIIAVQGIRNIRVESIYAYKELNLTTNKTITRTPVEVKVYWHYTFKQDVPENIYTLTSTDIQVGGSV